MCTYSSPNTLPRAIVHLNVADFAVAVERVVDSRLRRRPLIVAPQGAGRAAVYDMSEEAYGQGVRKGMLLNQALRRCRDAAVTPPHPERYEQAMADLFRRVRPYSPRIEITDHQGHLFVDLSGTSRLFGPPQDVAARLRKSIRNDLSLDPIWTLAANKLVAKVASRLVKPVGEYIVRPGEEAAFLAPLPLHLFPGIENTAHQRLAEFNLIRAGQVATLSPAQLEILCGRPSPDLLCAVRGIDPSPVRPLEQEPPVIRLDHNFAEDSNNPALLAGALYRLVEQAGTRLRKQGLAVRRIGLILDYSDGKRTERKAALRPPAADDRRLFQAAQVLLDRILTRRVRVRRLGLICDRPAPAQTQLELFDQPRAESRKQARLLTALDRIRERYGEGVLWLGRTERHIEVTKVVEHACSAVNYN